MPPSPPARLDGENHRRLLGYIAAVVPSELVYRTVYYDRR